jgi:hypothetical protein
MNREHPPCSTCAKFTPGHCAGFDRPAQADDRPCVLFMERGTYDTAKAARSSAAIRAELQQREDKKLKTIPRASANEPTPQAARAAERQALKTEAEG